MSKSRFVWVRPIALLAAVSVVASCAMLPRSGPNKREIFAGSVQNEGDAFIVTVDERVTRATSVVPSLGFSKSFVNAGVLGSDTIRAGDTLGVSIWENVDDPLLGGATGGPANLQEVQVDGSGFIFVPYAGRIRAAGSTPEAVRRTITRQLDPQTPDPQVEVRRLAGDGSTISITGYVGAQGIYPIERPTRTLSAMLAQAGGVTTNPEIAQVVVIRGAQKGRIWFNDLYKYPELDIPLRGGDRVLIEEDSRAFTALGSTGAQSRISFETQTLSAIEAIAQVGGLLSTESDPTGVFVFRNESAGVANQVLGRGDLSGEQRMVYVLNLTEPNGLFRARDFDIRDGDTLYVTEAPLTQFNKVIASFTGSLSNVAAASDTVDSLSFVGE